MKEYQTNTVLVAAILWSKCALSIGISHWRGPQRRAHFSADAELKEARRT